MRHLLRSGDPRHEEETCGDGLIPAFECAFCAHGAGEHHGARELLKRARAAGLSISAAAVAGLKDELEKLDRIAAFDRYLAGLEDEHGPITEDEMAEAAAWIDQNTFVVDGERAGTA